MKNREKPKTKPNFAENSQNIMPKYRCGSWGFCTVFARWNRKDVRYGPERGRARQPAGWRICAPNLPNGDAGQGARARRAGRLRGRTATAGAQPSVGARGTTSEGGPGKRQRARRIGGQGRASWGGGARGVSQARPACLAGPRASASQGGRRGAGQASPILRALGSASGRAGKAGPWPVGGAQGRPASA